MSRDQYEQLAPAVSNTSSTPTANDFPAQAPVQKDRSHRSRSPVRTANPLEETRQGNVIMQAAPIDSAPRPMANGKAKKKRIDENGNVDSKPYADRTAQISSRAQAQSPVLVKGDHLMRDIDRAPPGDPPQMRSRRKSLLSMSSDGGETVVNSGSGSGGGHGVARKRSQFFEDAFSARDGHASPAKERVRGDALVLAEVRTNIIVADEFSLITELSANLAVRYRRPLQSIIVTLQHNSCMCFGGSFDPAYIMSVYALPSEVQPTTNKRNAALIQRHMEEALGVPPTRGFLRFEAVPEANLAYGGKTTAGHMDEASKAAGSINEGNDGVSCRSPASGTGASEGSSGHRKNKASRKLSVKSLSSFRSSSPASTETAAFENGGTLDEKVSSLPSTANQKKSLPPVPPVPPLPQVPLMPVIPERSSKGSSREKPDAADKVQKPVERKINRNSGYSMYSASGQSSYKNGAMETEAMGPDSMGRQKSRRVKKTKSFMASLLGLSGSREISHA